MTRTVSWQEVTEFVNKISQIHKEKHFTGVYGIPRGGLVPAVMISYALKIPLLMAPSHGCIIVDDIADTGRSLCHYLVNETQMTDYFIATIYYHNRSIVRPNYYMKDKGSDWVMFPWEVNEA